MPKKVFYGDLIQLAKIQKIFAGNPNATVKTKKTLSIFGNEDVRSVDTRIKGVALGNEGLVFTFKEGRHILKLGDEISISQKTLERRYRWEKPSPILTTVIFTNSLGKKVTITLKK